MGLLNSGGFLSLIFLFVENGLQLPWLSLSFKEQMRTTANQGRSCQEATWGYIKGSREAHQEDWLLFSFSGFSVPGICQVRILEQVVISFSRGSSWRRDPTPFSCAAGGFFTVEPIGKPNQEDYLRIAERSAGPAHSLIISASPPWNHCYEIPHQILPGWDT